MNVYAILLQKIGLFITGCELFGSITFVRLIMSIRPLIWHKTKEIAECIFNKKVSLGRPCIESSKDT